MSCSKSLHGGFNVSDIVSIVEYMFGDGGDMVVVLVVRGLWRQGREESNFLIKVGLTKTDAVVQTLSELNPEAVLEVTYSKEILKLLLRIVDCYCKYVATVVYPLPL
ncbi:hypothetical protein Tco_0808851 [Tanacetum coccineum]